MPYRVELEIFRGPLDLLLYLVRKHEVDICEIPIALITEQFLDYLEVITELDLGEVGDFISMASTLVEIKSRDVLPHGGEEPEPETTREDLVQQLLEYKKFRDAASILEERSRQWQQRFARLANDLPAQTRNLAEEPIHEVELWDLVSAFSRIVRDNRESPGTNIVYDDTPIETYMTQIHAQLVQHSRLAFMELFQPGMHKSTLIGMFLAVLELVRHYGVRTVQEDLFSEIYLLPGSALVEGDLSSEAAPTSAG